MTEEDKQRAEQLQALEDKIRGLVDEGNLPLAESAKEMATQIKALEERFAKEDELDRVVDVPEAGDMFRKGQFSLARVASSLTARSEGDPNWRAMAPAEWEVSDVARAGDPSTTPDAAGGFIVPASVQYAELIMPHENLLTPVALGARQMTGLRGKSVSVPIVEEEMDASSPAEHGSTDNSELAMGQVLMTPKTAHVVTHPSREFLEEGVGATGLLDSMMGEAVAKKIARMGFNGSGAAGEPTGVKNAAALQTVDFTAGGYAVDPTKPFGPNALYNLLKMEGTLEEIDALDNEATSGWAVHPRVKRYLAGIKSENAAAGTFSAEFGRKSVYDAGQKEILGRMFRMSGRGLTVGAQTDAILGDWSQQVLGLWGGMRIEASSQTERCMRRREVMLSMYQRYDYGYFRPHWFVAAKNWDLTAA